MFELVKNGVPPLAAESRSFPQFPAVSRSLDIAAPPRGSSPAAHFLFLSLPQPSSIAFSSPSASVEQVAPDCNSGWFSKILWRIWNGDNKGEKRGGADTLLKASDAKWTFGFHHMTRRGVTCHVLIGATHFVSEATCHWPHVMWHLPDVAPPL